MTDHQRAPPLHDMLLADSPTLATLKSRALHDLAETANTLQELMQLVRDLKGIKEPDKYAPHYRLDGWYSLIRAGNYKGARLFILGNHS